MFSFLYHFVKIILLIILPFILLIRGSLLLMQENNWSPYQSLLGGAGITILVLFIYFSFFFGKLAGRFGSFETIKRRLIVSLLVVGAYLAHGIFFFSSENAKTSEVKSEFLELQPILRLSLSTLIHLDKDLILTDAERKSEDYAMMGLKENKNSKHYKQADGFVHAVDLRTNGRSELRNFCMKWYFTLMGFKTLRHGGTGDHLHVSL